MCIVDQLMYIYRRTQKYIMNNKNIKNVCDNFIEV